MQRHRHMGQHFVTMETETEVLQLHTKECLRYQKLEEAGKILF